MQNKVNLIIASEDDCAELATFNKSLIDDGGANNTMSLQELDIRMYELLASGYIAIIFELDGEHIGYTLIDTNKTPMFVRHYYIAKKFRRKGYGTSAFKKLIDFLKIDKIDLSVLVSNDAGYKFWESCGLTPYEVFMHYRE